MMLSEKEKSAIQEQLERLLANPHFSNSRRFPSFMRYVVGLTLNGHEDALKERTLGVEVFGRKADYDTASDPIVRVTAAEIRKRIAQYYQEPGHESELRISLPAGSYVPQFQGPANEVAAATEPLSAPILQPAVDVDTAFVKQTPAHHHFWRGFVVSFLVLIVVAGGGAWLWQTQRRSPFEFFWGPVLQANDPVLLCIADQQQYSSIELRDANDPNKLVILNDTLTAVVMADLSPIAHVAGLLQANRKKYSLKGESATNLTDLRAGPTIFIGAFDNAWTLRLTAPLRYHFVNDPQMAELGIVDSKAPTKTLWMVNRKQQLATNNYQDYAIIARFTDNITGEPAIVVAGVARGGTIAAGEFLTDPGDLAELMRAAKAAGNKQNMEVILGTQIIGGQPGAPTVEAMYFW